MIRKAIIVVLTLCAIVVLLLGWTSRNDISMLDMGTFDFTSWHLNIGWEIPRATGRWAFGGFAYDLWEPGGVSVVHIPLWILVALFVAYPTIAFIRGPLRRWRRHRKGLCTECSYDLTGNESGVCPECGIEIKKA